MQTYIKWIDEWWMILLEIYLTFALAWLGVGHIIAEVQEPTVQWNWIVLGWYSSWVLVLVVMIYLSWRFFQRDEARRKAWEEEGA
ncbi:hypothetical protein HON58_04605 [Candidatus Peregrinibacteria bacterium]|jgi:membrane protein implicated in regulation of membrane protease activity|nr:hypothetical protein [Candidatus Peregrinibacteria bacterium]